MSIDELRSFLAVRLPQAMVPAGFSVHEALPVSRNGKVDRTSLARTAAPGKPTSVDVAQGLTPTQAAVLLIWREILGCENIRITDDFFQMGAHSMQAARLVFRVKQYLGIKIPIRRIFQYRTAAEFAASLDGDTDRDRDSSEARLALMAEDAVLNHELLPASLPPSNPDGAMLLTGATGFLGSYLLRDLLTQNQTRRAMCLVRAPDEEAGRRRIVAALEKYGIYDPELLERVGIVCGDLSLPRFGLLDRHFEALAESVGVIYHSGANLDLTSAYQDLRGTNVLGTREVLRLAFQNRLKEIHYVSTVSVFDAPAYFDGRTIFEDTPPPSLADLTIGYAQTKWIAESLIRSAGESGLPVTVYRAATVVGDRVSGTWKVGDFLSRAIRACIDLGAWPALNAQFHLSPVDFLSEAIARIFIQAPRRGVLHLLQPTPVLSDALFEAACFKPYGLVRLENREWKRRLVDACMAGRSQSLAPLLPLFEENPRLERASGPEFFVEGRAPQFDCAHAREALRSVGMDFPSVAPEMFGLYLAAMTQEGYIEPPLPPGTLARGTTS